MSNTFIVYGAGRMGRAVAIHLAKSKSTRLIRLVDINQSLLSQLSRDLIAMGFGNKVISVLSPPPSDVFFDADVCVATCGYQAYPELTKKCIEHGVSMVDLGGNRDVVEKQFSYDEAAKQANVTIVPDCGLAPGMINVLAMRTFNVMKHLTDVDVSMKVGGLPYDPGTVEENPWQYTLTWSGDGLINEYEILADVLKNGKQDKVEALSEQENLMIDTPWKNKKLFEAFVTGGGSSNLPNLLQGQARDVSYKTIRYRGHNAISKTLRSIGLFDSTKTQNSNVSPRQVVTELLEKNFKSKTNDDIVIALASAEGTDPKTNERLKQGINVFCRYDDELKLTAMAQTTGYSAAIVAQMIAEKSITAKGVCCGENVVDGAQFIERLISSGISVEFESKIV